MKTVSVYLSLVSMYMLVGCTNSSRSKTPDSSPDAEAAHRQVLETRTLLDARVGFSTKLASRLQDTEPLAVPSTHLFSIVRFEAEPGLMSAYVSQPTDPQRKYPAMIWITGGFPAGGIGRIAWEPCPSDNDQSAKVYRERGMVMMYPTFRGCSGNPGFQEGFYGEVNDVIAAAQFLKQQPFVDPDRIFLGGHSTGGTLALLVAQSTDLFRAVICFGPVEDPHFYGPESWCFEPGDERERTLRAPVNFMSMIRTPTVVVEGTLGNAASLLTLQSSGATNPWLSFVLVPDTDHFAVLSQVNAVLAQKIMGLKPSEHLSLQLDDLSVR